MSAFANGRQEEVSVADTATQPIELAVVIPTLNERENVAALVDRLGTALVNGESKLDTLVAWEYLTLLLDKFAGPIIPVRFLLFAMIGGFGVLTHLATLWLAVYPFGIGFAAGQGIATMVAMTGNFLLNNLFTYRDRRLRGLALATGLLSFYAVCGLGAVANVGIASHLFDANHSWWLAGLGGAAIGAVWNYAMSSVFVWRSRAAAPAVRQAQALGAPPKQHADPQNSLSRSRA